MNKVAQALEWSGGRIWQDGNRWRWATARDQGYELSLAEAKMALDEIEEEIEEEEENSNPTNPIVKYCVRVPGCTAWSEHRSESAAYRAAARANRVCRPGHQVFAVHANGDAAVKNAVENND